MKVNESDILTPISPQDRVIVKSEKVIPDKVVSVLFVPCTPPNELAKMIRKDEQAISKLSGYRIKIVERCRTRLGDLLKNKGPTYGQECGRDSCQPCKSRDS